MARTLSDRGIAVFAFAAYHQLTSGETVTDVVLSDGAGHAADPEAIAELETAELAKVEGGRAVFTAQGKTVLDAAIAALRGVET